MDLATNISVEMRLLGDAHQITAETYMQGGDPGIALSRIIAFTRLFSPHILSFRRDPMVETENGIHKASVRFDIDSMNIKSGNMLLKLEEHKKALQGAVPFIGEAKVSR